MTITEAKRLRIVDYLARIGYHPHSVKASQYWYLSPLRKEDTPSFKVNDRLNEWYDFGAATGGDLVELGKHLYQTNSVSEVLAHIERRTSIIPVRKVSPVNMKKHTEESEMQDLSVVPLRHYALLSYLHTRGIDEDFGRMFCREVHYELRGRRYFALAFCNLSGGYEVRNPYYKGCIKGKDISIVKYSYIEPTDRVYVFEGFMDLLSYLTLKRAGDTKICIDLPGDYLVMNSVNNLKRTLQKLEEYNHVHCFLDNDLAGQKSTETIISMYGQRIHDEAYRYMEYKDLNDYLRDKRQ